MRNFRSRCVVRRLQILSCIPGMSSCGTPNHCIIGKVDQCFGPFRSGVFGTFLRCANSWWENGKYVADTCKLKAKYSQGTCRSRRSNVHMPGPPVKTAKVAALLRAAPVSTVVDAWGKRRVASNKSATMMKRCL